MASLFIRGFATAAHKQARTVCVSEGGPVRRAGSWSDLSWVLQVAATRPNMTVPLADSNKDAVMVNFLCHLAGP